jgi:hypothetical protein
MDASDHYLSLKKKPVCRSDLLVSGDGSTTQKKKKGSGDGFDSSITRTYLGCCNRDCLLACLVTGVVGSRKGGAGQGGSPLDLVPAGYGGVSI